jgi:hypothetical protein
VLIYVLADYPGAVGAIVMGSADGYGNPKTSKGRSAYLPAPRFASASATPTARDGSFEFEAGEPAFAPGSSGWTGASGKEVRCMELFLRGGSA